jgi:1,4-dihydroxy-2-naphthoate polyprenyltransferase
VVNLKIWRSALAGIPSVSKEEWGTLDLVSRWLVSSRAAVLVMTFISCAVAGLFALRAGSFRVLPWIVMTIGLVLGHATNNQFNDYTDFVRGVDKDNYFRSLYGPQPVAHGLLTTRQLLGYFGVTMSLVVAMAVILFGLDGWDPMILVLLAIGVAFVLLYTWPLKYIGAGEIAVMLVWGPLMIGGGYYALTRHWSWEVVWGSSPYVLGVTTVILGKHIDKIELDEKKGIHTLPVLMGERNARRLVLAFLVAPLVLVAVLIGTRYFTPAMGLGFLSLPALIRTFAVFLRPKPVSRPEGFPDGNGGWPLYFAPTAFVYTRTFGTWFLIGLVAETALRIAAPGFWR